MTDLLPSQDISVRLYTPADRAACMAIFSGNVPEFFDSSETADFARFLDTLAEAWAYQVLEQNGRVVACGGLERSGEGKRAGLCWGMVDRSLHRQGLGRKLTEARLRSAADMGVEQVVLDTSQHTQAFYAQFGFEPTKVVRDGYGPGLDRWEMVLQL